MGGGKAKVKLGAISVDIVSDGSFLLDGGALFGQVPRTFWELQMKPDRKNRVRMGLNCLLVQTPAANILVGATEGRLRPERQQARQRTQKTRPDRS